jgi:hypothetical protein
VEAEIKEMLDIDVVDWANRSVFHKRTTAIKAIIDNMPFGERQELNAKVEKHKLLGLPPEIQR